MQNTSVTFLLDKSGSMQIIKQDTIGGYNEYIKGLQEGDAADHTVFTFLQFDSYSLDKIHLKALIKAVPNLTNDSYVPRGRTPLIDAVYKTIKAVEIANGPDDKIVICIQTDGLENDSTEHTFEELNALIKEKIALGWQFNFMGVGIDAYDQGQKMGIGIGSTISTTHDPAQMRSAYRSMGKGTASYAAGQSVNTDFSFAAKAAAGDYTAQTGTVGDHTVGKAADPLPNKRPPAQSVKSRSRKAVDDFDLA
jgi:hypothetical protein